MAKSQVREPFFCEKMLLAIGTRSPTFQPHFRASRSPTSAAVRLWAGRLLWIAALFGGVFGLLGGWLIDRYGRKTIMVASILVYSLAPVAAALSHPKRIGKPSPPSSVQHS